MTNHNQFAVYTQGGVIYALVGGKYASTSDAYLESLTFDGTCRTYAYDGVTCTAYKYSRRTRLTTVISTTYGWVESLVIDETNAKVYAHVTTRKAGYGDKGNLMVKCDLILTQSTCNHVSNENV
jgi:hypothetical protein